MKKVITISSNYDYITHITAGAANRAGLRWTDRRGGGQWKTAEVRLGEWVNSPQAIRFGGPMWDAGELVDTPEYRAHRFRLVARGNAGRHALWEIEVPCGAWKVYWTTVNAVGCNHRQWARWCRTRQQADTLAREVGTRDVEWDAQGIPGEEWEC